MLIHLRIIHGCFCTAMQNGIAVAETHDIMYKIRICPAKSEIFCYLAICRKCLLILSLNLLWELPT